MAKTRSAPPRETPLRRDANALVGVMMQTLGPRRTYPELASRLAQRGLDLIEAIEQALVGIDREIRVVDADAALQSLRCLLRMARDLDIIDDEELLGFIEQSDRVGRQIGGWLAKLTRG